MPSTKYETMNQSLGADPHNKIHNELDTLRALTSMSELLIFIHSLHGMWPGNKPRDYLPDFYKR